MGITIGESVRYSKQKQSTKGQWFPITGSFFKDITMRTYFVFLIIMVWSLSSSAQSPSWKLIWSEEFNYQGFPDSTKWGYETKGNATGWGNNEKQFYTQRDSGNAWVKNGSLHITAQKEKIGNREYSSARLTTKYTRVFHYGRLETRAKLPTGRGTWPAIWMLGSNHGKVAWPECGEIDIMEHVGYEPDSIFATIHTGAFNHMIGTQKTAGVFISDPYSDFHTYTLEWTAKEMRFLLDGKEFHRIENKYQKVTEWPFDQPFYLILNLAIGGNWGGKKGIDDTIFPATFEIDYVRFYQYE